MEISAKSLFTVFEVQGEDQFKYISPYTVASSSNVDEVSRKICLFLRERSISFVVKEGPSLESLTSAALLRGEDFLEVYKA